jgi:hypothetical protein
MCRLRVFYVILFYFYFYSTIYSKEAVGPVKTFVFASGLPLICIEVDDARTVPHLQLVQTLSAGLPLVWVCSFIKFRVGEGRDSDSLASVENVRCDIKMNLALTKAIRSVDMLTGEYPALY